MDWVANRAVVPTYETSFSGRHFEHFIDKAVWRKRHQ
jgi:hypothetical protein